MIGFAAALLFGAAEMLLLSRLLRAATSGRLKTVWGFLLLKLLSYGAAISLLVFVFPSQLINCLCGFTAGMPLCAIIYFIYRSVKGR